MAENEGEGDDQQDNLEMFMKQGIAGLQLNTVDIIKDIESNLKFYDVSTLLVNITIGVLKANLNPNALLSKHTKRQIWKMFMGCFEPLVSIYYSRWLELGLYIGFKQGLHDRMIQEGTINASTQVEDYDKTDLLLDSIIATNLLNALSRTNTEDHVPTLFESLNKMAKDITHRVFRGDNDREFDKATGMGGLG